MTRRLAMAVLGGLLAIGPAKASELSAPVEPAAPQGPQRPRVPAGRPAIVAGELSTPRFRILHTQRAEGSARALAQTIEGTRDRFQDVLGRDWPGVTEVRLGLGRDELQALALLGTRLPGWAAALAYPEDGVILLDARSVSEPDGQATFRHELSHVALGQLGGPWPRWFQEGLAVVLTGEQLYSVSHFTTLFRAVRQDRIFSFEDLAERWPDHPGDVEVAYAQSAAFVAYLGEQHGSAKMGELLDGVRDGEPFETAFGKAFRTSLMLEESAWRAELPSRYSWVPIVTGGSTLWALAAGITVVAFLRRRRANARRRALQAAEEEAQEAAMRLLEAEKAAAQPGFGPSEVGPELPKDKPTLH